MGYIGYNATATSFSLWFVIIFSTLSQSLHYFLNRKLQIRLDHTKYIPIFCMNIAELLGSKIYTDFQQFSAHYALIRN